MGPLETGFFGASSDIEGILEEVVAIVFRREEIGGGSQTTDEEGRDASTDGAKDERGIKVPAGNREVLVVVVEERLGQDIVSGSLRMVVGNTQET